jgi:transposase-like protein
MRALISGRARRGLTWSELAEQSGVPRSTLHWWYRRFRDGSEGTPPPEFVEVVVAADEVVEAEPITVVLRSGVEVRVPAGFDAAHLRRVVEALDSRC